MDRHSVRITVAEWSGVHYRDEGPNAELFNCGKEDMPPTTLMAFAEWLQTKIDAIPPAYRAAAKFLLESEEGYEGSHYPGLTITYDRPETDDEMARRMTKERLRREEYEQQERATLAALQKKYAVR